MDPHARQTQGHFYPDTLPLYTDNDLRFINQRLTPPSATRPT